MNYSDIIQKIRAKDNEVTQCFFFYSGPSWERIQEIRRTDLQKARTLPKPVCDSCRPTLLKVLHNIYGSEHFDYEELVSDFYYYLIEGDRMKTIANPNCLMGWITKTAYYFFQNQKKKRDQLLEKEIPDSLNSVKADMEDDQTSAQIRDFVREVLAAMPNRTYAMLLDEVALEVAQHEGREKSELLRRKSEELGIKVDNLYVKISLAKKQFQKTALELNLR